MRKSKPWGSDLLESEPYAALRHSCILQLLLAYGKSSLRVRHKSIASKMRALGVWTLEDRPHGISVERCALSGQLSQVDVNLCRRVR